MNTTPVTTPFNQTVLLGTRWGLMVGLQCDPFQTSALMLYGEWSQIEVDTICSVLKPGDVALDIGSNIGTIAVPMAKRVGSRGRVFAFEPQRAAHCCLCANAALTHCLNQLHVINAAVSDFDGTISVPVINPDQPFNVGGVRLNDPDYDANLPMPKEEVACLRIDSLALPRCELMKIDVEAMEAKVLAGATETVRRHRPVIFAETLNVFGNELERQNMAGMTKFFADEKYEVRQFAPPLVSPNNQRFCPDNIFPGIDTNVIAWPAEKEKPEWFGKLPAA